MFVHVLLCVHTQVRSTRLAVRGKGGREEGTALIIFSGKQHDNKTSPTQPSLPSNTHIFQHAHSRAVSVHKTHPYLFLKIEATGTFSVTC